VLSPEPSRSAEGHRRGGHAQAIAARYAAADVIQADGAVVLPGLINTHGHAAMVMYRGSPTTWR